MLKRVEKKKGRPAYMNKKMLAELKDKMKHTEHESKDR